MLPKKQEVFVSVTRSLPQVSAGEVTLGGVMALSSLDPLGPAPPNLQQPVLGACLAEGPDGLAALEPEWLVATDGRPLAGASDPEIRAFVRDAAARQAAGIVVQLGEVWHQIPPSLTDEAAHADLALLALPAGGTLSAFLRQVNESTGINDVGVLSMAIGLQSELIGALSAGDMEAELVRRIAASLGVTAVLYDDAHHVIAAQGDAPIHLIGDALGRAVDGDQRLDVGRWRVAVSQVASEPHATSLALAWPSGRDVDTGLIRSTRFAVQQLLRAHARTLASELLHDQIQRGQILLELLEGVPEARRTRLRDGLVLLHFPSEGIFQVHIIEADPSAGGTDSEPDPVLALVQSLAAEFATPALMAIHGNAYVVLHAASDAFTDQLTHRLPDRGHGASSSFHDLTSTPAALRQAQMSMATSIRTAHFTPFHRVGFVDFILGHLPEDTLRERAEAALEGIADNEALYSTLVEYLRNGLDIQATGRALHLHPNSIRYRLSKVEEHLGRTLTDPATITLLYLTLHDTITRASKNARISSRSEGI